MRDSSYTPQKVQALQRYIQDRRDAGAAKRDRQHARALAIALRSPMHPLGPAKSNPHLCDDYEAAEAEYRAAMRQAYPRLMRYRQPVQRGALKFEVGGRWYSFEQARPVIRAALELGKSKATRSKAATWLAVVLHGDALDDYAIFQAQPALLWILEQLRPLPS